MQVRKFFHLMVRRNVIREKQSQIKNVKNSPYYRLIHFKNILLNFYLFNHFDVHVIHLKYNQAL